MQYREHNFVSAVVYVHDDGETVGEFLDAIMGIMEENFEHSEVICVNDGSRDGSVEAIRAAAEGRAAGALERASTEGRAVDTAGRAGASAEGRAVDSAGCADASAEGRAAGSSGRAGAFAEGQSKDPAARPLGGNGAGTCSLSIVHMSYFHGLELAMDAGMDLSIGDFVFEFDRAVLDFDPGEVMRCYRRCLEGYDIVSAVPNRRERLSSRLFYAIFDRYSGQAAKMHTESFRILSRRVINRVFSMNKAMPYRKAIYATQGLKTDSLSYEPISPRPKDSQKRGKGGGGREERRYRFTLAVDSLILFTEVGYRFSMFMTALMMLFSVFMAAYTIIVYATLHPVAGWTTTILFLSVAFLGLFGILTIIVKYLQILVDLVFRRQRYSFSEIEKVTRD